MGFCHYMQVIIGVTRRRDVANRREAGESNIATRMRMMLLGVFLGILALNLCHCLNCNCTNAVCPNVGTLCPNGRVLGDCGCCYVCIRNVSELCGGLHDILGKCESGLRCVYETAQSTSKLKIGFCEDPNVVQNITSNVCEKKNYFEKGFGVAGVQRCYEDMCGAIRVIKRVPMSCIEIGCGIERPVDSICCSICKQDKPRIFCDSGLMRILIPKSTMSKEIFSRSSLIDAKCKGYEGNKNFIFSTTVYNCGTLLHKKKDGRQSYSNAIETTDAYGKIKIKREFYRFLCTFEIKTSTSAFFKVKQKITAGVVKGIDLSFASKGGRLLPTKKKFLASEKRMDVAISNMIAKKYKLRIAINWCYLSVSKWIAWMNGKERYLFKNGCIIDKNVRIIFKRGHAIWFSYTTNKTQDGLQGKMYLHCDIILCSKRSTSPKCTQRCM